MDIAQQIRIFVAWADMIIVNTADIFFVALLLTVGIIGIIITTCSIEH